MRFSEQITRFAAQHREEYLRDLAQLISIPSVSEELYQASDQAPFGVFCVQALEQMMGLCQKYRLETSRIGSVIGMAEYGGGERELDIVSHLDVQPAGPGWQTDPFSLVIDGDTAYGRGVSDDKGPALAALYAVRALRENSIPLRRKVRLVFGTGEEYGISDIHYYTDAEPPPPFMFTPDHSFPIVNGSNASYTASLRAGFAPPPAGGLLVTSVAAGENRGAVPGECTAVLKGADAGQLCAAAEQVRQSTGLAIDVHFDGGCASVACRGLSTHAVKADKGKSALTAVLQLLTMLPLSPAEGHRALRSFAALFPHGDVYGRAGGFSFSDELSGPSLYNVGIFRYSPSCLEAQLRATLPVSTEERAFLPVFHAAVRGAGLSVTEERFSAGSYTPLTDPYVEKLLKSYEYHSGQKAFGIVAGGGSYAHSFPRGVAFGCEPYGVDTRMHGAQEYVSIEHMMTSIRIFAQAIVEICG